MRHMDLEIGSFADDISLHFAFVATTTTVAEATKAVVSLFQVGAPFFCFDFFFSLRSSSSSSLVM